MADKIRKVIDIPVIYVGQINEFQDIDTIKEQNKDGFIAVGRPLVADPDLIGKYLGKVKQILQDIDHIILATGMQSFNPFSDFILDKPVHIIGDAIKAGKVQDVIESAFQVANSI